MKHTVTAGSRCRLACGGASTSCLIPPSLQHSHTLGFRHAPCAFIHRPIDCLSNHRRCHSPTRAAPTSTSGGAGTIQARHALTRVWRPHVDDVDRLSRGEGAKIRGTGCRDIPHRLNVEEHGAFKAAKKKGYVAVRGTGYRRERKGNPLPNVFRQWCDAKAWPCIVIEQDMFGGPLDQVVVDLSTLRLVDADSHAQAQQVCTELATSLGVRQLAASERDTAQVPFNVLPLASTVAEATGMGEGKEQVPWAAQSTSTSTPMNVIKQRSNAGGQKGRAAASSGGRSSSDGDDRSAAEAAAARLGSQVQAGVQLAEGLQQGQGAAGAGGEGHIQALEVLAVELQARLDQQAAAVRTLKEQGGRGNADPEVQAAVQVLLTLKAQAATAQDDLLTARAEAARQLRQASSARRTAWMDVFDGDGDMDSEVSTASQSSEAQLSAAGCSPSHSDMDDGQQLEVIVDEQGEHEALLVNEASAQARGGKLEGGADGHPYCKAAIWQLYADPLFFEADRTTAKQFAKLVVERLAL